MAKPRVAKRDVKWARKFFEQSRTRFYKNSNYTVAIEEDTLIVKKSGYFSEPFIFCEIPLSNLEGSAFHQKVYSTFVRFNHSTSKTSQALDFINILYFIFVLNKTQNLFYTRSGGELKQEEANEVVRLVASEGVSGYVNLLLNKDRLGSVLSLTNCIYIPIQNCFTEARYCIQVKFRNFLTDNRILCVEHHVLKNTKIVCHEDSDSYWYTSDLDSSGIPPGYEEIRLEVCTTCGTSHQVSSMYNGVCYSCLGLTSEKVKLHSYTTRVPSLIRNKSKETPKKTMGKSLSSYYKQYLSQLREDKRAYNESSSMLYGIELEYESNVDKEKTLVPILVYLKDHAIIKTDGSLDNGIEIVTCAASLDIHLQEMKSFFDNFPSELIEPLSTCGMHVHVSREALSLGTQSRLLAFMNNKENRELLTEVAGRFSDRFAGSEEGISHASIFRDDSKRYRSLNNTNPATLEFRIFSSTDDWDTFVRNLQFVTAIVEYCKPCETALSYKEHMKQDNFISWLKQKRKDYPLLHKLIFNVPIVEPRGKPVNTFDNIPF